MKINTIETLLKEIYRYEPEILKKIFQFMFIPIYEDKERKYKYVELLPKPGTDCISGKSFICNLSLQSLIISKSVKNIGEYSFCYCQNSNHLSYQIQ